MVLSTTNSNIELKKNQQQFFWCLFKDMLKVVLEKVLVKDGV